MVATAKEVRRQIRHRRLAGKVQFTGTTAPVERPEVTAPEPLWTDDRARNATR